MDGNMCEEERKSQVFFFSFPHRGSQGLEIVDPGLWPSGQDAEGRHCRV